MRIWYDTEFIEDGRTIELISIGMVAEGRKYYAVNADMPVERVKSHPWLSANVWPHLPRYLGDAKMYYDDPQGVPMRTNDLKQECVRLGDPDVPKQENEHHALADALHARDIHLFLDGLS